MAKDFAGKWAWRFPQEEVPEGCHDEGCHPCDSTLASFAESPINSGISGAPYHPMTQGKIERYHRSMKNVVKLEHYYYPWELEHAIRQFVQYYNHERYHESLDNITPADMYFGRYQEIMDRRAIIKYETLQQRRKVNLSLYMNR